MSPAMDAFPCFEDGDVLVSLTPYKEFQLHSNVLRRVSLTFAELLGGEYAATLSVKARKEGAVIRFGLQLGRDGNFGRIDVNSQGQTRPNFYQAFNDNGLVLDEKLRYIEWLFGVFYGKAPALDDKDFSSTVTGCVGLLTAAENIEAVDSVREVIDLALLRTGNNLWGCVASNPIAWTNLGRRIQSPSIFKDGVIHTVGRWNEFDADAKADLHPEALELCQAKFEELETAKEVIEIRILGHYPAFLCREVVDKPGRSNYSNDIYMWMAISFFRQFFAQAISDGRNRVNKDGGYKFYNSLRTGGTAYLDHETFENFHQYFPMSSKACNVLEANMNIMKEDVKPFVEPIVVNNAQVDRLSYPDLKWLTCINVEKDEFPWFVAEQQRVEKVDDDFDS